MSITHMRQVENVSPCKIKFANLVPRECGSRLQKPAYALRVLGNNVSGRFSAGSRVRQPGLGPCLNPPWLYVTVESDFISLYLTLSLLTSLVCDKD